MKRHSARKFFIYVKNRKNLVFLRFLAVCVCICFLIVLAESKLRPIIDETAVSYVKNCVGELVNTAVYEQIKSNDDYGRILTLEKNGNGEITAVRTDMILASRLKTEIISSIISRIGFTAKAGVAIPIGSFSGSEWLNGRGPSVNIKTHHTAQIDAKFISSFSAQGINQTRHSIVLQVNVNLNVLLPGRIKPAQIINEFPIAETILVGTVPESYTYIGNSEDAMFARLD